MQKFKKLELFNKLELLFNIFPDRFELKIFLLLVILLVSIFLLFEFVIEGNFIFKLIL